MLAEIYIEVLLVDKELADQVWDAWDKAEIDDQVAWLAWWLMVERPLGPARTSTSSRHSASTPFL